ncbi:MAG: OmpA family protein, partial [Nitrospiraceae bacterium]
TQTGTVTAAGTTTLTAGAGNDITLNNVANNFSTVGITSGNNVILTDATALSLGASTVSGTLNVTTTGALTQSGALAVTGTTTLTAGAANDIALTTPGNDFTGAVSITSGNNVALTDVNALILGVSTVAGTLNVTTNGALTQSGAVSVAGTTTLEAGAVNDITLNNPANTFSTVGITSGNNVTVVDSNALDLGNATVSSSLNVTAGGAITQTAGTLNAGPGSVTLNGTGIGTVLAPVQTTAGAITAGAGSGGVFITESDGASFTATATGAGAINLTSTAGTLTIAGATSTGSGPVTLTSDSMAIAAPVSSTGALTLQPVTPGQSIGIAGGAGGLSLSGASLANLTDGFSSITIGRSNGTGTMTVNAVTFNDPVTLQSPAGGTIAVNGQITGAGNASVTLDGVATTLGANIVTAGNPITINDPVTLSAPVTLDAANAGGAPAGANLTVAGTMNGAQALTLQAGTSGTIALNGAIGGITPVAGLTIGNAGDVTFAGNVITTGNLMQTAGTGTTTLNGATVGGTLSFTTNAITLATAPVAVTGGNITLAAASTVTQNANLTAAGAGTINATTTVGAITMAPTASTASGTGAITYSAGTDVILGSLSTGSAVNVTAQGGSILSAGGAATHVTAGANSTLQALGGVVGTSAMPITVNVNPGTLGVAATTQIGGFSGVLTGTVVPSNTLNLLNVPPGCVSFNGACVTTSTNGIPLSLLTRGTVVYLNPDVIVPTYYDKPSRSITIPRLTSVYVPASLLEPSDVTISGGGVRQGTITSLVPEQLTTEPESPPLSSLLEPSDVTIPGGRAQEETIASSVPDEATGQSASQPVSRPLVDVTRLNSSVAQSVSQIEFKSGQGDLSPTGRELLSQVSEILKGVADMRIQIEGHTDNVPIGPKLLSLYPSNWELAKARAANAVRILVEEGGIDPAILSAVGRADTRPVASNATAAGRNKNRRIEIVLTPKAQPEAAVPPTADQSGR